MIKTLVEQLKDIWQDLNLQYWGTWKFKYMPEALTIYNDSVESYKVAKGKTYFAGSIVLNDDLTIDEEASIMPFIGTGSFEPHEPNLIRAGINILGTEGTFTADATATPEDIMNNYIGCVNGEYVPGIALQNEVNATSTELGNGITGYTQTGNLIEGTIPLVTKMSEFSSISGQQGDIILIEGG